MLGFKLIHFSKGWLQKFLWHICSCVLTTGVYYIPCEIFWLNRKRPITMYGNIWFCEIEKNRLNLFQMLHSCYIFNRNIITCPHMLNYFVYYRTNTYIWIYRVLFSISRFDYCQEDFTQVFLRCSGVFWLSQDDFRDHKYLYYQELSHLSNFGRNEVRVCWYIYR